MSLSPEGRDILQEKAERFTEKARAAAGDEPKQAAAYYSKAAELNEKLAESQESQRLSRARSQEAQKLRSNSHAQLREAGLTPKEGSRNGPSGGAGRASGTDAGSGSNGADEEAFVDTEFVSGSAHDPGRGGASDAPGSRTDRTGAAGEDSDAESFFESPPSLTLDDVGGLNEEVDRIRDAVLKPYRHPAVYEEIGVDASNGVLLHGPPGTGKSLIARAVANALDEPYAGVSAADLGSEYVNRGAQNVQKLFAEAAQIQPCVVFIDELDSLARSRSEGPDQTDGSRQMVTQLLQELDRIQGSDILVLAATNLVDDIDGAIRRSGRFDRKVHIGAPNADDRREIFRVHLKDKKTAGRLDFDELVAATEGFSGADIAAVVEQAGQAAGSRAIDEATGDPRPADVAGITQADLLEEVGEVDPGIEAWEDEQRGVTV
jgi:transitional endoplasmic reticulum ATPase